MRQRWRVPAAAGGAAALLLSGCTYKGATVQGQQIHTLYGIIFALAALVFILVEGLLVWSIVRYRMRNAIPGHPTTFTFTASKLGTFPGQCTEFCGLWHSRMTFYLKVVNPSDYATWVKHQVVKAFGGTCKPTGPTIHLVAKNTSWNTNCIAVKAGQPFTVTVANLDAGVNHNFGIWPSLTASFSGKGQYFQTGRFPGVDTRSF